MQNLREKLVSAGLVTANDAAKAEVNKDRKSKRRRSRRRSSFNTPDGANPEVLKVIESHRVRGDTRGDAEFNFENRDGTVGKLFVTKDIAHGLAAGRMAVVEFGGPQRHVLVEAAAVDAIRAADPAAIRFSSDQPAS